MICACCKLPLTEERFEVSFTRNEANFKESFCCPQHFVNWFIVNGGELSLWTEYQLSNPIKA